MIPVMLLHPNTPEALIVAIAVVARPVLQKMMVQSVAVLRTAPQPRDSRLLTGTFG
jgi:hypothetical protein